MTRKIAALLLMILLLCVSSAMAGYQLGDTMEDFSFTTCDGQTRTLYDVLAEKDMALINLWATWCPPCKGEFPHMQQAYEQYRDQIEIIALSTEPTDDLDKLAAFAAEQGLTFPVGRDETGLAQQFGVTGIPTSIVVDRFGRICFVVSGAMPDAASFTRLFGAFVGEDYTRSVLWRSLPVLPDAEPATARELAWALDGADIRFEQDSYAYAWPMQTFQVEERSVVTNSNQGMPGTLSALRAILNAQAGDAIAVTFKTSTYPTADLLRIYLNGEPVKAFGGEKDWQTYAVPVTHSGEQTLLLAYEKQSTRTMGQDRVWIDSVTRLTGEQARAALAANPVYPTAESTGLTVVTPGAREIVFDDPRGVLQASFGDARYYIIPGGEAAFTAHLAADVDPETACAFADYSGSLIPLTQAMTAQGYALTSGIDTVDTTGYAYSSLMLYTSATGDPVAAAVFFADEANATALVEKYFPGGSWAYAAPALSQREPAGPVVYRLTVLDQHGAPVPGAMVQICDESMCQVLVTGADGSAQAELPPQAYELHILKLPNGYSGGEGAWHLGAEGGDVAVQVEKE